jgi:hypothetical protein
MRESINTDCENTRLLSEQPDGAPAITPPPDRGRRADSKSDDTVNGYKITETFNPDGPRFVDCVVRIFADGLRPSRNIVT